MSRTGLVMRILALAAAMITIAALSAWVVFTFLTRGGEVTVPDLRGAELRAALELASREELGIRISGAGYDPSTPPGHVISQEPGPGGRTRKNRIIHVVVSQGTHTVLVPSLTGLSLRRAELQLAQSGLTLGRLSRSYDEEVPDGSIIAQTPVANLFVPRDTGISLLLSEGPRPRVYLLPDLTGLPMDEVLSAVRSWGLRSGGVSEEDSTQLPPGTVTEMKPPPGSPVSQGQSVHLTVSRAPAPPGPSPLVLFQYAAPPGLLDRKLTLILETEAGQSIVYEGTVDPGTSVSIPVSIPAPGRLKAYVDGSLLEERKVP
ncbi:MAG: PASTA domain-containing protein [bacterium]|nr:MAG: PASTA domain-containing protein [bacterium]